MANAYSNKDFDGRAGFFHGMKDGCRYIDSKILENMDNGGELPFTASELWWNLRGIDFAIRDSPKSNSYDKGFRLSCRYFNASQKLLVTKKMFSSDDFLKAVHDGAMYVWAFDKVESDENKEFLKRESLKR